MPDLRRFDIRRSVTTPEEGYIALAAFIVLQAIKDYQSAFRRKDRMAIDTLERWFYGPEFKMWSDLDPDYIVATARAKVRRTENRGRKKAPHRVHPGG